jgi:hypothetical protein
MGQGLGLVVGEKEQPVRNFGCFQYFKTCVPSCIVVLKEESSNIFSSTSPETLLQCFKNVNVMI